MTALRARSRRAAAGGLLGVLVLIIVALGVLLSALGGTPWTAPSDALNVDRADADALALSLEIDPVQADRLVAWRSSHGGFRSLAEFAAVPCIDEGSTGDVARAAMRASGFDPNVGDARVLAAKLGIPRGIAVRIVAARSDQPGGRFARAADLASTPVLDPRIVARASERLIVRSPGRAIAGLLLVGALVCCVLGALFAVQQRIWPYADPWLAPLAGFVTGVSYISRAAVGDPLRDSETHMRCALTVAAGAAALLVMAWLTARSHDTSVRPEVRRPRRTSVLPWLTGIWLVCCAIGNALARERWGGFCWIGPVLIPLGYAQWLADRGALVDDAMGRWNRVGVNSRADRYGAADALAPAASFVVLIPATGRPAVAIVTALALVLVQWLAGLHASRRLGSALLAAAALAIWFRAAGGYLSGTELALARARLGWAVSSSGWHGSGLGLGHPSPELAGLAEGSFARVAEELGLIGALAVVLSLATLVTRLGRAALRGPDDATRLRLGACAAALASAGAVGLWASTLVIPAVGALLPFAADSVLAHVTWYGLLGLAVGWSLNSGPAPVGAARTGFRHSLRGLVTAASVALVGVAGLRLVWLQVVVPNRTAGAVVRWRGDRGEERSLVNPRLVAVASSIERGSIIDRDGRVLATSSLRDISARLPDDLSLARRYYRAGRYYPYGAACATVVGVWLRGAPPTVGIESTFDRELRGFGSWSELAPVYRSRNLPGALGTPRRRGRDVKLSISGPLQEDAFRLLRTSADGATSTSGALVVLSAVSGTPIVAASAPSFDPNAAVLRHVRVGDGGIPPMATMDRASATLYRPGSLLKLAAAVALSPDQIAFVTECRHRRTGLRWSHAGRHYASDAVVDDPSDAPHGRIGLGRATKLSCEVYFADATVQAGVERLNEGLRKAIPNAVMPDIDRMAETLPEVLAGRGDILVSPLGMAGLIAGICSGAGPVSPSYWYEVAAAHGRSAVTAPAAVPARAMTPGFGAAGPVLVEALRDAVTEGPAERAFAGSPLTVGGKTASVPSGRSGSANDAWFVGFAPARRPAFAVACVIEGGGSGLRRAAPVVARMLGELSSR